MIEDNVFREVIETCQHQGCLASLGDLHHHHTERAILEFFYRHSPEHTRGNDRLDCPDACWRTYSPHLSEHHPELWAYILLAMRPSRD